MNKSLSPQHLGWVKITIDINPVTYEALSSFLFDLGCEGIVSESFGDNNLVAYIEFHQGLEEMRSRIELFIENLIEIFPEATSYRLSLNKIEDQDWDVAWRSHFRPDRVTEELLIIPAWDPVPHLPGCHIIRIEPGPAFGTGQHASTRMCLKAMEKHCLSGKWTMLDVGTGSGILAVFGAMLGAQRIAAIDIDPEALRWARKNIALNNLPIEIELSGTPLIECIERFNIVTANLILGTILELGHSFNNVLVPEGILILSGILDEQVNRVEDAFKKHKFSVEEVLFQEEWACVILTKNG